MLQRRLRRARRGRARLRAARHGAAPAGARRRPGARRAARRHPRRARDAAARPRRATRADARRRATRRGVFEALLAVLDGLSRDGARAARDRGPALGRRVDARVPALPRRRARRRADPRRRHLPARRAAPPPPAAPAAGRARARPRAADRPRARSPATSWASSSRTSSARRPSAALVDRLYARSEGNPLFTEELLAAGLDGRGAVPPSLAAALALRIERLGDDAQEVVRVLVGRRAARRRACWPRSPGSSRRALRDGLREAVGGHIVVLDGDRYALRHALLREAVHDDLLPGERAELHRALARALERERPATAARAPSAPPRSRTTTSPPATSPRRSPRRCAPASRRWTSRPTARARRCSSARSSCGTACPTPPALTGADEVELLERAAACHFFADDVQRSVTLCPARARAGRRGRRAAPRRLAATGCCSARCGRCCARRRRTRRSTAASRCSPTTGRAPSAPACSPARRSTLMVQSRYHRAVGVARRALAEQEQLDDPSGYRARRASGRSTRSASR